MAIRIVLVDLGRSQTRVDFDLRLQYRKTDFMVYANNGYETTSQDNELLRSLMHNLLTDDSGVIRVHVTTFQLTVDHSQAVNLSDIQARVEAAVRRTGRVPLMV